jgi:hypothetical protein
MNVLIKSHGRYKGLIPRSVINFQTEDKTIIVDYPDHIHCSDSSGVNLLDLDYF